MGWVRGRRRRTPRVPVFLFSAFCFLRTAQGPAHGASLPVVSAQPRALHMARACPLFLRRPGPCFVTPFSPFLSPSEWRHCLLFSIAFFAPCPCTVFSCVALSFRAPYPVPCLFVRCLVYSRALPCALPFRALPCLFARPALGPAFSCVLPLALSFRALPFPCPVFVAPFTLPCLFVRCLCPLPFLLCVALSSLRPALDPARRHAS